MKSKADSAIHRKPKLYTYGQRRLTRHTCADPVDIYTDGSSDECSVGSDDSGNDDDCAVDDITVDDGEHGLLKKSSRDICAVLRHQDYSHILNLDASLESLIDELIPIHSSHISRKRKLSKQRTRMLNEFQKTHDSMIKNIMSTFNRENAKLLNRQKKAEAKISRSLSRNEAINDSHFNIGEISIIKARGESVSSKLRTEAQIDKLNLYKKLLRSRLDMALDFVTLSSELHQQIVLHANQKLLKTMESQHRHAIKKKKKDIFTDFSLRMNQMKQLNAPMAPSVIKDFKAQNHAVILSLSDQLANEFEHTKNAGLSKQEEIKERKEIRFKELKLKYTSRMVELTEELRTLHLIVT